MLFRLSFHQSGLIMSVLLLLICGETVQAQTARWNPQTTDWPRKPVLSIGDWGFDRSGYPSGLYIEGVTVKAGQPVGNPVIYDNDVYNDVFDPELVCCMASLGQMNLVGLIVTPVLTDF